MTNNDRPVSGGGLGGQRGESQPVCRLQDSPAQYASSMSLDRELTVLRGLASMLVAALPEQRSAISQHVLDEIVQGWADLLAVGVILERAALRPAGPECEP